MRLVTLALAAALLLVQAQLWFGGNGMGRVVELGRLLEDQQATNDEARQRNQRLAAEVRDLARRLHRTEHREAGAAAQIGTERDLHRPLLRACAVQ